MIRISKALLWLSFGILFSAGLTAQPNTKFKWTAIDGQTLQAITFYPYGASAGDTQQLNFRELAANGTNSVGFQAPDSIAADVHWELPDADATYNLQCLYSNASARLDWITCITAGDNLQPATTTIKTEDFESYTVNARLPAPPYNANSSDSETMSFCDPGGDCGRVRNDVHLTGSQAYEAYGTTSGLNNRYQGEDTHFDLSSYSGSTFFDIVVNIWTDSNANYTDGTDRELFTQWYKSAGASGSKQFGFYIKASSGSPFKLRFCNVEASCSDVADLTASTWFKGEFKLYYSKVEVYLNNSLVTTYNFRSSPDDRMTGIRFDRLNHREVTPKIYLDDLSWAVDTPGGGGGATGWYKGSSGNTMLFRTPIAGAGIGLTTRDTDITIALDSGTGPGTVAALSGWTITGGAIHPTNIGNTVVIGNGASVSGSKFEVITSSSVSTGSDGMTVGTSNTNPLQLVFSLTGSSTAGSRRGSIYAVEQNVAWRNLALQEFGGNVILGAGSPPTGTAKFTIASGAKGSAYSGATDQMALMTTDASNPLQMVSYLGTSATAGSRYAGIDVSEAGLTSRPLIFQEGGGNVGVGILATARLDVANGAIRARWGSSTAAPTAGQGVEIFSDAAQGYIFSYNRDTSTWLPLQIVGSVLSIGGGASATELRLFEPSGSGTNYAGFKAQAMSGNLVWVLPATDSTGTQCLDSNASLQLAWASCITALTGDVTASGPGSAAAAVAFVGTSSAANVHAAEVLANAATDANAASTIVKRDASGNFAAGTITGALSGTATALATNGSNCSAGNFPLGVDAAGAAEGCGINLASGATVNSQTIITAANRIDALAATTSAEFFSAISDEVGTGKVLGDTNPIIQTSLNVGPSDGSAGAIATVNATVGTEIAPALTSGNWTLGAGWAFGTSPNVLDKNADGTGTATPSGTFTIAAGTTYKMVITISAWSVGTATINLGGTLANTLIQAATTYTEYVNAFQTGKIIITPTNTSRFTISALSVKAITAGTGDAVIAGALSMGILKGNLIATNGQIRLFELNAGTGGPSFVGLHARSSDGTITGTLTATQSGDEFFHLCGAGYDDVTPTFTGCKTRIRELALENWTNTAQGTYVEIATTAVGTTTTAERVRFTDSGIGIAGKTQGSLGTPSNGTIIYCSDCTIANPCAGGGNGALAKRLNGAWVCN